MVCDHGLHPLGHGVAEAGQVVPADVLSPHLEDGLLQLGDGGDVLIGEPLCLHFFGSEEASVQPLLRTILASPPGASRYSAGQRRRLQGPFFDVASSCPGVFSHISLHTLQAMLDDDGWTP